MDTNSKAEFIREYLKDHPSASTADVIEHCKNNNLTVNASYVRNVRSKAGRGSEKKKVRATKSHAKNNSQKPKQTSVRPKYPRHSVEKALRISRAILEQNAGKACTPKEAAAYLGMKAQGPFNVEVGSGIKYGFLERPESGKIKPTDLARQILRPKNAESALEGYRTAVLQAPDISEVYKHYRGENLPDDVFFKNTIADSFSIPEDSFEDFKQVFVESLQTAQLVNDHTGKLRVLDVSEESSSPEDKDERIKRMGAKVTVHSTDTCFVMQPFAAPLGGYYDKIYKPAIEKAGLQAVRADAEIFATGKIMDQVWRGINSAKVLVAELTSRNPNVFYELGLAHALKKPVVLISSNENDVPFDLHHIRVIYYEMSDPFWGNKLIDKVAENILSALRNPEEAIFRSGDISA